MRFSCCCGDAQRRQQVIAAGGRDGETVDNPRPALHNASRPKTVVSYGPCIGLTARSCCRRALSPSRTGLACWWHHTLITSHPNEFQKRCSNGWIATTSHQNPWIWPHSGLVRPTVPAANAAVQVVSRNRRTTAAVCFTNWIACSLTWGRLASPLGIGCTRPGGRPPRSRRDHFNSGHATACE